MAQNIHNTMVIKNFWISKKNCQMWYPAFLSRFSRRMVIQLFIRYLENFWQKFLSGIPSEIYSRFQKAITKIRDWCFYKNLGFLRHMALLGIFLFCCNKNCVRVGRASRNVLKLDFPRKIGMCKGVITNFGRKLRREDLSVLQLFVLPSKAGKAFENMFRDVPKNGSNRSSSVAR